MQMLYYILMCFSFDFYFVQRIGHGCIGKQVLQWYLRHFAATWGVDGGAGREGKIRHCYFLFLCRGWLSSHLSLSFW